MAKVIFALVILALAVVGWRFYPSLHARIPDDFQKLSGSDREAAARAQREAVIKEKYRAARVVYPGEIFIRWLKREAQLELWARDDAGPFHLIATYPILKSSGSPGPKRREGDQQVPEGFYEIDRFNPESLFHLSLRINYPNAADRILSDRERPGSDIYIHGKNASIGCGPIGDAAIEEVYLAALDARAARQARIEVHVFPGRMQGAEWQEWAAEHPKHADFWAQLQPFFDAFERTHLIPKFTVSADGRYVRE